MVFFLLHTLTTLCCFLNDIHLRNQVIDGMFRINLPIFYSSTHYIYIWDHWNRGSDWPTENIKFLESNFCTTIMFKSIKIPYKMFLKTEHLKVTYLTISGRQRLKIADLITFTDEILDAGLLLLLLLLLLTFT